MLFVFQELIFWLARCFRMRALGPRKMFYFGAFEFTDYVIPDVYPHAYLGFSHYISENLQFTNVSSYVPPSKRCDNYYGYPIILEIRPQTQELFNVSNRMRYEVAEKLKFWPIEPIEPIE